MFDPFGAQATKIVNFAQSLAMGGIGIAIFTAPSSNMVEQAAGAVVIGASAWALAKSQMKGGV